MSVQILMTTSVSELLNSRITAVRWEAFKANIQDQMMECTKNKSNKQFLQMLELEDDIKELNWK